jgi:hypothetical protein
LKNTPEIRKIFAHLGPMAGTFLSALGFQCLGVLHAGITDQFLDAPPISDRTSATNSSGTQIENRLPAPRPYKAKPERRSPPAHPGQLFRLEIHAFI